MAKRCTAVRLERGSAGTAQRNSVHQLPVAAHPAIKLKNSVTNPEQAASQPKLPMPLFKYQSCAAVLRCEECLSARAHTPRRQKFDFTANCTRSSIRLSNSLMAYIQGFRDGSTRLRTRQRACNCVVWQMWATGFPGQPYLTPVRTR